jgi:hypothetical protein
MQPSQWNLAELHGPLLSDLLHQTGHIVVSVKNEQALHLYKMHHVMAHLPFVTRIIVRKPNLVLFQEGGLSPSNGDWFSDESARMYHSLMSKTTNAWSAVRNGPSFHLLHSIKCSISSMEWGSQ